MPKNLSSHYRIQGLFYSLRDFRQKQTSTRERSGAEAGQPSLDHENNIPLVGLKAMLAGGAWGWAEQRTTKATHSVSSLCHSPCLDVPSFEAKHNGRETISHPQPPEMP